MNTLYIAQQEIWELVFKNEKELGASNILLCGGTALARFYLNHRISYDLDFFIPSRFNPEHLIVKLSSIGVQINSPVMELRDDFCRQLSGRVQINNEIIKVDFIEDIYQEMFSSIVKDNARIEEIDGLYHRKIRTVSGMYSKSNEISGGRQTARDLFDLYILNESVENISEFVSRVNYHGANIPVEGLITDLPNFLKNRPYFWTLYLFQRGFTHLNNKKFARRCLGTVRRELTTKLFLSGTPPGLL